MKRALDLLHTVAFWTCVGGLVIVGAIRDRYKKPEQQTEEGEEDE